MWHGPATSTHCHTLILAHVMRGKYVVLVSKHGRCLDMSRVAVVSDCGG